MARQTFASLRHRNARLFFSGLWVSQIGSWMQTVALGLYVKKLAPDKWDGLLIGVAIAAQFVPTLFLGAWFGAFADRRNRLKVTVTTQSLMAVQAFALAVVTFAHWANIPNLIGLALLLGFINAVDNPARRGVVTELVEPKGIPNAMALQTATMTGSRAMGPAIAALMVTAFGFGWCFLVNAISFAAIIGALLAMDRDALFKTERAPRGGTPVRDGLRFVRNDPILRRVFIVLAIISTFAFNNQVSLPLLVQGRWHEDPDTWYGILLAVFSAGSFLGSLIVAGLHDINELRYYQFTFLLAGSAVAVALSPNVWWALALSVPMGIGAAGFVAIGNALTQTRAPGAMRSRILALVSVAFLGSTPIGGPITGLIGDLAGSEWSLIYGSIIAAVTAAWGLSSLLRSRRSADLAHAQVGPRVGDRADGDLDHTGAPALLEGQGEGLAELGG